tara:strand:+ start:17860 stop:18249 length:390 start_codon:yes stop_codon:yes gene_type:complete
MDWIKLAWKVVVEWSSKAWEAIKKLPGWAVVALVFCGALVVWLIKQNLLHKRRSEAHENLKNIEIEYRESIVETETTHEVEVEELETKRSEAKAELEEVERQIEKAAEEGPVSLAKEWKSFLLREKNDE